MAERGQISGGVLDGPLAFDNTVSTAAAENDGIASPVAGDNPHAAEAVELFVYCAVRWIGSR